jgi:hypothetical protein
MLKNSLFVPNSQNWGDRKCLGDPRESIVGLPDAILFLRVFWGASFSTATPDNDSYRFLATCAAASNIRLVRLQALSGYCGSNSAGHPGGSTRMRCDLRISTLSRNRGAATQKCRATPTPGLGVEGTFYCLSSVRTVVAVIAAELVSRRERFGSAVVHLESSANFGD